MRSFKLAGMLSVVLLAVPSLARATVYDAFADFDTVNNTNTTTWSYRYDDQLPTTRAAAPALHTDFSPHFGGHYVPGPDNYSWNIHSTAGIDWPGIAVNQTGVAQNFYGVVNVPVDAVWTTPLSVGSGGMSVVSWLAPEAGVYDIDYSYTMLQTGGNGIQYFVDQHGKSRGNLATGNVGATALDTTGPLTLTGVQVNASDRINFVMDAGAANWASSDTSAVSARLTKVSGPRLGTVWDSFQDFNTHTNSETSTWSYRYDNHDPSVRQAAPTLHTDFGPHWSGNYSPGPDNYSWNSRTTFGMDNPGMVVNDTGVVQTFFDTTLPADTLWSSPFAVGSGGMAVLSFLAPVDGGYNIEYSFTKVADMSAGNDGVGCYVDLNGTDGSNLAYHHLTGNTGDGTGVLSLSGVMMKAGDRLNFVLDGLTDLRSDTTAIWARIRLVPEPSSMILLALGGLAILPLARRRRR